MRRFAVLSSLCVFLLGCTLSGAKAQEVNIAGDLNSPDMQMDISLRDADLSEVLAAMFNTTGGRYQLQIGNGVVGRIGRLQLIQTPFDKALDAVLGTEYSYKKDPLGDNRYLYRINGRGSSGVPDTGGAVPLMAPPTTTPTTTDTPPILATPAVNTATRGSENSGSQTIIMKKTGKPGPGGAPATEETSYIRLIKIMHVSTRALTTALDGQLVELQLDENNVAGGGVGVPGIGTPGIGTPGYGTTGTPGYGTTGTPGYGTTGTPGYGTTGYGTTGTTGYGTTNTNTYRPGTTTSYPYR